MSISQAERVRTDPKQGDSRRRRAEGRQMVLRGPVGEGGGGRRLGCIRPSLCSEQIATIRRISGPMGTVHTYGSLTLRTCGRTLYSYFYVQ
jgi:hypothetical protein